LGALLLSFLPGVSRADQLAIEHKDVGCFVAGQFPVLDACFNPGPGLARARVFFRPEGAASWYYVEAKTLLEAKADTTPNATCRKAILPKPKKSLVNTRVEYYVEATGQAMETSQTETYRPMVVDKAGSCKNKLVAAGLPAAAVQVFPALPAAFAAGGGLSAVAAAAVVGAGVAGTTTVVAVAANNSNDNPSPATTQPASPTTTAPPVTVPPTTATTTQPPAASFNPVYKVFRNGVLEPATTIVGTEPLQLRLFMCDSTGPSKLKFQVSVNGSVVAAGCDNTITLSAGGFTTSSLGGAVRSLGQVQASATSYSVLMQMQSDAPGNDPKDSRALNVQVDAVPPPTTTTTSSTSTTSTSTSTTTTSTFLPCTGPGPDIVVTSPTDPTTVPTDSSLDLKANVTVSPLNPGPVTVDYFIFYPNREIGTDLIVTANPPLSSSSFDFTWDSASIQSFLCDQIGVTNATVTVSASVTDGCQMTNESGRVDNINISTASCPTTGVIAPPAAAKGSARTRESRPPQPGNWVSQLEVPGGRGQVVVNGNAAFFPPAGRSGVSARVKAGENRVEATLVQSTGQSGLWRFDLSGERAFTPGSLRVIAGQVALITGDTVAFQMKGRPGERVVFTFQSR
jgi:hypothetical protein